MGRRIEVLRYDPSWPVAFGEEATELQRVFGGALHAIHHVGSTAVPGLPAKPVIDILAVLSEGTDIAQFDPALENLGYRVRGECLETGGTPGRFYYSKPGEGERTHHLHVCREGHFQIVEMIRFVQYLREHQQVAEEYGRLKITAASECEYDNVGYMARKHDWVRATVRAALEHYGEPNRRNRRA